MSPAKFTQAFIVLLIGFTLANTAHAQTETVLYNFTGGSDGGLPFSNLTSNGKGNFYGTASEGGLKYGPNGYGTVFELSPNGAGGWNETTVYTFCSATNCADGAFPVSDVIFDSAGNLYGTTYSGGTNENGAVFELSPKGKKWKEKVLYSFASGSNQGRPQGRMLGRGGQQQLSCPVIEADASLRKIKALNGVEKANFLFCGRNKDSGSVGAIDSMTMSAPVPE